jgi:hypothetical protein
MYIYFPLSQTRHHHIAFDGGRRMGWAWPGTVDPCPAQISVCVCICHGVVTHGPRRHVTARSIDTAAVSWIPVPPKCSMCVSVYKMYIFRPLQHIAFLPQHISPSTSEDRLWVGRGPGIIPYKLNININIKSGSWPTRTRWK